MRSCWLWPLVGAINNIELAWSGSSRFADTILNDSYCTPVTTAINCRFKHRLPSLSFCRSDLAGLTHFNFLSTDRLPFEITELFTTIINLSSAWTTKIENLTTKQICRYKIHEKRAKHLQDMRREPLAVTCIINKWVHSVCRANNYADIWSLVTICYNTHLYTTCNVVITTYMNVEPVKE